MPWLAADTAARLRRLLAAGEPTVAAIAGLARAQARRDPATVLVRDRERPAASHQRVRGDDWLIGNALVALLDGDRAAARRALDYLLWWTEPWNPSDLGAAAQALLGAIAWDCCAALWDAPACAAAADRLATLHRGFREINSGNPHVVTNNWWAVTHGGALVAALAAHGQAGADGARHDLADGIAWARGRLDAFAAQFGEAGLYHEGLGYQSYTCSLLLPALMAGGAPLLPRHPWTRRMAASLAVATALAPAPADGGAGDDGFGLLLSWNDAGLGWPHTAAMACALALAPERERAALRWLFDRVTGIAGPRRFAGTLGGWFFTLLGYPFEHEPVPPEGVLPRAARDGRQGLLLRRSRWRDGDDAVLGAYAKATWVGGHRQQDAGSVRLIALGEAWIVGGGQARGERPFQSVLMPIGGSQQPDACGALLWDDELPTGGSLGIDLRRVSGAYHERYLAAEWSGACGVDAAFALLDLADDHQARAWRWTLSFLPHQRCEPHADGAGFTLHAGDARLDARFLAAVPRALTVERMPDSARTYSSGGTVAYPGRPYLAAEFAAAPHLGVYVAMTVSRLPPPPLALAEGVDVLIGAWRWRRPFGAAVPEAFRPGASGGLCAAPAGVDGFRARAR